MMPRMSEADLILNPDGSVYHLHLRPEHLCPRIIAVGDQDRVERVSRHFDRIDERIQKREFVTHIGELKGQRIMAISSGIGTDNIDILMNELDALANIDLVNRLEKPEKQVLEIIRIGTSGALQPEIPLGASLASSYGFGLDTLMSFYPLEMSKEEKTIVDEVKEHLNLPFRPYLSPAGNLLLPKIAQQDMWQGTTLTAPGFYAPQGRKLRFEPAISGMLDRLAAYRKGDFRFTNFEMETAAYYGFGRLMGHQTLSINAIIANRPLGTFAADPHAIVDRLIEKVLERLI
jgi:uridine phosphorylase